MNKRSLLLALLVLLLMIAALLGLPLLAGGIARDEMRAPVIETCTPNIVEEMDEDGVYMGQGRFPREAVLFHGGLAGFTS